MWFYNASIAIAALAQWSAAFPTERSDFDVAQALLDHGVELPDLSYTNLTSRSSDRSCSAACASLTKVYPSALSSSNARAYKDFNSGYWSANQAEVEPHCIFKPQDEEAITIVLLISRHTQCPFAVKSGGHAAFKGASNSDGGITISLEKFNQIDLCRDKKSVTIGSGNTWGHVYESLAKSDLAAIGGRVAPIGVGGLTLGGGISFFSNIHGWACDNVISYNIVLASGIRTTASVKQNPDLYKALRGGGNNFGIVTSFTVETFSLPGNTLWGGSRLYTEPDFPTVLNAFHHVMTNSASDPNAGSFIALASSNNSKLAMVESYYAKPNGQDAAIWNGYKPLTPIMDTTGNITLVDYVARLNESNPYGHRESYYGMTVHMTSDMLHAAKDIFYAEFPSIANIVGAQPVLCVQGITTGVLKGMSKNGGNSLGLDAKQPLYILHIAAQWEKAEDDVAMYAMITRVFRQIKKVAKEKKADSRYMYMNYASLYQDVLGGYGEEQRRVLRKVARRYDPSGVMQRLQPGGFKLDGAPVRDGRYFSGL